MHELCGVRSGNLDCFNWKQAIFGERIPRKYGPKVKIWHILRGIILWTIWIERNDKVFNHVEWYISKVKLEFGTNSLFTLKRLGNGWWSKFGLVGSRLRRYSKALINLGGL